MGEVATNFDAWERAEIARSDQEALHTLARQLAADETQMARYMAPPLDSVFPLEHAYALLGNVTGQAVLDLGCGSGENSLLLARRGAKVIGVDISESLLALAQRRLEVNGCAGAAVRFLPASAHRLPIPDASIDVVLGIALVLLVVSLAIPRSFSDLRSPTPSFTASAICFLMLVNGWYSHYVFFRRYGLCDRWTVLLDPAPAEPQRRHGRPLRVLPARS